METRFSPRQPEKKGSADGVSSTQSTHARNEAQERRREREKKTLHAGTHLELFVELSLGSGPPQPRLELLELPRFFFFLPLQPHVLHRNLDPRKSKREGGVTARVGVKMQIRDLDRFEGGRVSPARTAASAESRQQQQRHRASIGVNTGAVSCPSTKRWERLSSPFSVKLDNQPRPRCLRTPCRALGNHFQKRRTQTHACHPMAHPCSSTHSKT